MKKGALISSVAMLLVAVVAFTTASFAWFTGSLTPSIGEVTVNVTTSNALLVSAEYNKSFKSTLPVDELIAVASNQMADDGKITTATLAEGNLTDISTSDGPYVAKASAAAAFDFVYATGTAFKTTASTDAGYEKGLTNKDLYSVVPTQGDTVDGNKLYHYIKFDLYFTTTISSNDQVAVGLDFTTANKTTFTGSATDATDTSREDIVKAIRVGFVSSRLNAGANTIDSATTKVKVLAPNEKNTTNSNRYPVDTLRQIRSDSATYAADTGLVNADFELFTGMKSGEVFKTTVYIWVEGNDVDAHDYVSGTTLKSLLQFTGVSSTII